MESLSQGSAAWLMGVKPRTLRDRQAAPRNTDGTYNAQSLVAWHLKQGKPIDDDPLLSGNDSPALERFRNARADREELELAVRREQLIDVEDFLIWFRNEVLGPIQKNLDRLQRKFGNDAVAVVAAGLRKADESIGQRFQQ
jgi:hypothetical protein